MRDAARKGTETRPAAAYDIIGRIEWVLRRWQRPPACRQSSPHRARRKMTETDIAVGDIYEDCALHPVLCTQVGMERVGDPELTGISLIDGSYPRSCSL